MSYSFSGSMLTGSGRNWVP